MAERRSGRSKGVPHHPLVEALASDPNKPPERATKLFGYPGPAAEGNMTRLWLDTDLTTYVDVPDDAIVHSQTLDNDQGTLLWVEPEAKLTHSTTRSQEVQAEFLGGSIAEGNLGQAAGIPEPGSQWGGTGPTRTFPCEPQVLTFGWGPCLPTDFPCRVSVNILCPSAGLPCQSADLPCVSDPRICEPIVSDPRICEPFLSRVRCPTPPALCHKVESVARCSRAFICEPRTVPSVGSGPCVETFGCPDPIGPIERVDRFR